MDLNKKPQWRVQGVDGELSGDRFGRRRQIPQAPVSRPTILQEMTAQREFAPEVVPQFFGKTSNAAKAARLHKEDPAAYARMRRQAELDGLIDAPGYFDPARDAFTPERRVYSEDELRARQEFSDEYVKGLYKADPKSANPSESLAKIAKEDPAKYQRIRTAAVSYGYISAEAAVIVHQQPKAQAAKQDDSFVLSQEFSEKFRVPSGTKMTNDEFQKATNVYLAFQEAQRIAAQDAAATPPAQDNQQ